MQAFYYISIVLGVAVLVAIFIINKLWQKKAEVIEDGFDRAKLQRRQRIAFLLHACTLLFLVLALWDFNKQDASIAQNQEEETAGLVFLLDVSESMQDQATQEWCQSEIERIHNEWKDRVKIAGIAFGGKSELLFNPGKRPAFDFDPVKMATGSTDIQQAIKEASASLVQAKNKKIMLFTDGKTSVGDALKEAYLAGENDIAIYPVLPPGFTESSETITQDSAGYALRAPSYINAGEPFAMELMLPQSLLNDNHQKSVTATILVDGQNHRSFEAPLHKERDFFSANLRLQEPGIHHIQVQFATQPPVNFEGYVTLLEPARVLLLENYNSGLAKVLFERNFTVDVLREETFYLSPEELLPYNLIFLNDIPGHALLEDTELNLLDFVHENGGGLVYNMGPVSAKPDFKERALYPILPMKPDKAKDDGQRISLCIGIDNSGSMQLRGLDKAAKSLIRSKDNMEKVRRLSIFTFDSRDVWLTSPEPQPYTVSDIVQRLESVKSGGGGINVFPALEVAYRSMVDAPYKRHVLLITDLDDSQQILNSAEIASRAYRQHEITTHVLAIGDHGLFRHELKEIAQKGNGSYKEIRKAGNTIAQLNWEGKGDESVAFMDKKMNLANNDNSPITSGIPSDLPEARGYVPMLTKEGAIEVFQINTGEQSFSGLSHWIQPKGRVAMLNAGIENPEGWYNWPYLDKFWSQLMRWVSPLQTSNPYLVKVVPKHSGVEIHFEKNDPRQSVSIPTQMSIQTLEGEVNIPMNKLEDDHYFGAFIPVDNGLHQIDLLDETGFVVQSHKAYFRATSTNQSVTAEQLDFSADPILLQNIAEVSGGEVNPDNLPFEVNTSSNSTDLGQEASSILSSYWRLLLLLALISYGAGAYVRNGISSKAVVASYPRFLSIIASVFRKK